MEKRQIQEHMEKRSGAGDEGGTSHMGHNGGNSSRSRAMESTRWWPVLHLTSNKGISQVSPFNRVLEWFLYCISRDTPIRIRGLAVWC